MEATCAPAPSGCLHIYLSTQFSPASSLQLEAEVVFAVRNEYAQSAVDVLVRFPPLSVCGYVCVPVTLVTRCLGRPAEHA